MWCHLPALGGWQWQGCCPHHCRWLPPEGARAPAATLRLRPPTSGVHPPTPVLRVHGAVSTVAWLHHCPAPTNSPIREKGDERSRNIVFILHCTKYAVLTAFVKFSLCKLIVKYLSGGNTSALKYSCTANFCFVHRGIGIALVLYVYVENSHPLPYEALDYFC